VARVLVQREMLDLPRQATRSEVEQNLRDIMAANRWLGGTSVVMRHLSHLIGPNPARQPIRILDLATGAADIPIAVAEWARTSGITVQITAVDANPEVVEFARRNARLFPEIRVDRQDVLLPAYRSREFHFVTCSQVLHHLTNEQAVCVLRAANRLSSQGIVISDLRRRTMCASAAWLGSHLLTNRLSRHDARISFQNAFTPREMRELAEKAGFPCWALHLHGPCRLALIVDKRTTACQPERARRSPAHAPMLA